MYMAQPLAVVPIAVAPAQDGTVFMDRKPQVVPHGVRLVEKIRTRPAVGEHEDPMPIAAVVVAVLPPRMQLVVDPEGIPITVSWVPDLVRIAVLLRPLPPLVVRQIVDRPTVRSAVQSHVLLQVAAIPAAVGTPKHRAPVLLRPHRVRVILVAAVVPRHRVPVRL
ncbi:MAG TPA: hypothetical protein DIW24_10105, partial [Bacteroidetes bacterium]|nr:hypothetical protein [Bacteroidota bacterium]